MDIGPLALIGGLIYALTTFAKRILPVNLKGWQTQLLGFAVGLGVVFLVSAAEITGTYTVNGVALNDYDAYSKVVLGLLATGLFAVIPNDLFKAIDQFRNGTVKSETAAAAPPQ